MAENKPEYIIIHHSLTTDGIGESWSAIKRYHMEVNGWNDIGYHKGIENVNGQILVFTGRADITPGAHTKELGMNNKSIGICVVGNYDIIDIEERYLNVLRQLCYAYMVNYNIKTDKILGHREVGMMAGYDWTKGQYKTCPGSRFCMDAFRQLVYKG